MLDKLDGGWWKGDLLLYKDKGKLKKGALTHFYEITDKKTGTILGYTKWTVKHLGFVFYPMNNVFFSPSMLSEIAQFVTERTDEQYAKAKEKRDKWKNRPNKKIFSLINVEEYRKKRDAERLERAKQKAYF